MPQEVQSSPQESPEIQAQEPQGSPPAPSPAQPGQEAPPAPPAQEPSLEELVRQSAERRKASKEARSRKELEERLARYEAQEKAAQQPAAPRAAPRTIEEFLANPDPTVLREYGVDPAELAYRWWSQLEGAPEPPPDSRRAWEADSRFREMQQEIRALKEELNSRDQRNVQQQYAAAAMAQLGKYSSAPDSSRFPVLALAVKNGGDAATSALQRDAVAIHDAILQQTGEAPAWDEVFDVLEEEHAQRARWFQGAPAPKADAKAAAAPETELRSGSPPRTSYGARADRDAAFREFMKARGWDHD